MATTIAKSAIQQAVRNFWDGNGQDLFDPSGAPDKTSIKSAIERAFRDLTQRTMTKKIRIGLYQQKSFAIMPVILKITFRDPLFWIASWISSRILNIDSIKINMIDGITGHVRQ